MKFAIAKSFERSLKSFWGRNNSEFAQIQTTLLKIGQAIHTNGLNYEKINEDYYSFRVNDDIRMIATCDQNALTIVYVDHHEPAYRWCQNNRPVITNNGYIGSYTPTQANATTSSNSETDHQYDYLSQYGFEPKLIQYLNGLNQDEIKTFVQYLSPEYQQLILNGNPDDNAVTKGYVADVLVINDDNELERALKLCYHEWAVFLHSQQRSIVDFPTDQNLLINGGPGTGKSIALIWRYVKIYHETDDYHKPVFIYRNEITRKVLCDLIAKLDPTVEPILISSEHLDFDVLIERCPNSHFLIDEAQNLSQTFVQKMKNAFHRSANMFHVTIACDPKQNIINGWIDPDQFEQICHNNVINLNYCYRSTEQIIQRAYAAYDQLYRSTPSNLNVLRKVLIRKKYIECSPLPICPLYGHEIRTARFSRHQGMKNVQKFILADLEAHQINPQSNLWAVILPGSMKHGEVHKMLLPGLADHIYTPSTCQGLEFLYGYVVKTTENVTRIKEASVLYTNYDFVAFSRFRDDVVEIIIDDN